jgi:DNA-binding protein H-NS
MQEFTAIENTALEPSIEEVLLSLDFEEATAQRKIYVGCIGILDKRLGELKEVEIIKLKAEFEANAAALGITMAEVLAAGSASNSPKKSTGAPKYRNSTDPTKTWTGRGKAPRWMIEHVEQGGQRADLEI